MVSRKNLIKVIFLYNYTISNLIIQKVSQKRHISIVDSMFMTRFSRIIQKILRPGLPWYARLKTESPF